MTKRMVLVTGHRQKVLGWVQVSEAPGKLAERDDVQLYTHAPDECKGPVESDLVIQTVRLIDPQDYLPFVHLMQRARVILTDSTACRNAFMGKPVLVMRDTTERPSCLQVVKLVVPIAMLFSQKQCF